MPTLEPGHVFERYRVIRWLGSGVSGESYEAEDAMLMRKVTLKLIQPQSTLPDSARRQFFRELQGTSALNHPYLAPILDYGELNGRLYIARKFVSNGSLLGTEGRLWFRPPLNEIDAIHYTHQIAQVLHYIHSRGYLHGALTFSNILVLRGPNLNNEPDHAPFLLADVGLAHFARRFGHEQKTPLPITAAPEQFGKRVTPASDQFALAVLLYFWLAGRPPYIGAPEEIEQLKLAEAVAPLNSLNQRISIEQSGILLRALSVYPEDRYPSVMAFADALLKTLPSIIPTIPITEPALFDGHITPSPVPDVEEREQEPVLAASPASEATGQATPDFDREPYVTPVLAIEIEPPVTPAPSPAEEPAPVPSFSAIPETDPAIAFEPDSPEIESDEAQPQYVEFAILFEPDSPETAQEADEIAAEPDREQEADEVAAEPDREMEQPASTSVEPLAPEPQEIQPAQASEEEAHSNGYYSSSPAQESLPESDHIEEASTERPAHSDEMPARIARVIITSPYVDEPSEVRLAGDEFTIGRAGSSAILLDRDNLTSRHHALLKREGNRYLLFDLRSANGVFVNGQKILVENEYELLDGDHISIGNYELIFRSSASDREREPTTDQLTPATGYEVSQLV
jgi:serine/threonine protein kinase